MNFMTQPTLFKKQGHRSPKHFNVHIFTFILFEIELPNLADERTQLQRNADTEMIEFYGYTEAGGILGPLSGTYRI